MACAAPTTPPTMDTDLPPPTPLPRRPPRSSLRLSIPRTPSFPHAPSFPECDSPFSASPPMPATPGTPSSPEGPTRPASVYLRSGRGRRKPVPSMFIDEMGNDISLPPSIDHYSAADCSYFNHSTRSVSLSQLVVQPEFETLHDGTRMNSRKDGSACGSGSISSLLSLGPTTPGSTRNASRSNSLSFSVASAYPQKHQYVLSVDLPNLETSRRLTRPTSELNLTSPPSFNFAHSASTPTLPRYDTYTTRATRAPPGRSSKSLTWFSKEAETVQVAAPKEPPTTSSKLWKWGFLFPPLWALGIFMCVGRDFDDESEPAAAPEKK